jgi:hypothetical protein
LARVDAHVTSPSPPSLALQEIFIKTLVQVLHVLALFTKYLDKNVGNSKAKYHVKRVFKRASTSILFLLKRLAVKTYTDSEDYGKILLGNSEVQTALYDLDLLTREESLMIAAETLVIVQETKTNVDEILGLESWGFLLLASSFKLITHYSWKGRPGLASAFRRVYQP